ncbi:RNA polymerase sigma factor [Candidatus Poribacteria bacterium]|nr:RNA polymerase sigma factor [Candidatus Poribacteria bacterium]
MPTLTDRQLVQDALRGDGDSFAALAEKYAQSVYALSYARLLHHADAEDVAQETFLRAYERLGQLRQLDRFESWVHRIAMTLTYDRLRRRARETPMDTHRLLREMPAEADAYAAFERESDAAMLVPAALRTLPEDLRDAFVMRHLTEASYRVIAQRLHISPMAAERRVQRARDRLQRYFRRRGDAHATRPLAIVAPMGDEFLAGIHEAWRRGAPPTQYPVQTAGSPRLVGVFAAGLATTMVLFAGSYGAHMRLLHWGDLRREGTVRYMASSTMAVAGRPVPLTAPRQDEARELIAPGDEWIGWEPVEPDGDSSVPVRASVQGPFGGPVAVLGNDFGVFKEIAPTHGEVRLDVLLRSSEVGTNASLSVALSRDADGQPHRIDILHKLDDGTWNYAVHGGKAVPFGAIDDAWHRVTITYDTRTATYDLRFDGDLVATDVPCDAAVAGRAVHGIRMHSGRGGRSAPTYFSQMRLSAVEGDGRAVVRAHRRAVEHAPISVRDRVLLRSGRIGSVSLDAHRPTYTAYPGERLRGSLYVSAVNDHGAAAEVHVIETPTWGDRRTAFRAVAGPLPPGPTELRVEIDRLAPTSPGTYHIIVASSAETAPEFVASGTNWSNSRSRWDDATDIAAWTAPMAQEAMNNGFVRVPWTVGGGKSSHIKVGAAAVRVIVSGGRIGREKLAGPVGLGG